MNINIVREKRLANKQDNEPKKNVIDQNSTPTLISRLTANLKLETMRADTI